MNVNFNSEPSYFNLQELEVNYDTSEESDRDHFDLQELDVNYESEKEFEYFDLQELEVNYDSEEESPHDYIVHGESSSGESSSAAYTPRPSSTPRLERSSSEFDSPYPDIEIQHPDKPCFIDLDYRAFFVHEFDPWVSIDGSSYRGPKHSIDEGSNGSSSSSPKLTTIPSSIIHRGMELAGNFFSLHKALLECLEADWRLNREVFFGFCITDKELEHSSKARTLYVAAQQFNFYKMEYDFFEKIGNLFKELHPELRHPQRPFPRELIQVVHLVFKPQKRHWGNPGTENCDLTRGKETWGLYEMGFLQQESLFSKKSIAGPSLEQNLSHAEYIKAEPHTWKDHFQDWEHKVNEWKTHLASREKNILSGKNEIDEWKKQIRKWNDWSVSEEKEKNAALHSPSEKSEEKIDWREKIRLYKNEDVKLWTEEIVKRNEAISKWKLATHAEAEKIEEWKGRFARWDQELGSWQEAVSHWMRVNENHGIENALQEERDYAQTEAHAHKEDLQNFEIKLQEWKGLIENLKKTVCDEWGANFLSWMTHLQRVENAQDHLYRQAHFANIVNEKAPDLIMQCRGVRTALRSISLKDISVLLSEETLVERLTFVKIALKDFKAAWDTFVNSHPILRRNQALFSTGDYYAEWYTENYSNNHLPELTAKSMDPSLDDKASNQIGQEMERIMGVIKKSKERGSSLLRRDSIMTDSFLKSSLEPV